MHSLEDILVFDAEGAMYKAYFLHRYLETLRLAEEAESEKERALHLQACRYYKDLIDFASLRHRSE